MNSCETKFKLTGEVANTGATHKVMTGKVNKQILKYPSMGSLYTVLRARKTLLIVGQTAHT